MELNLKVSNVMMKKKPSLWDNFSLEYDRYYNYFKLYLLEQAYTHKGCVLLGRGGAFFLKEVPGVLRIRLVASEETRIERIKIRYNCDEKYARKIMHQTDHDRNGFNKFFYNESWDNPVLYDIIFNTDKLSTSTIFSMVSDAVHTFVREKYDKAGHNAPRRHAGFPENNKQDTLYPTRYLSISLKLKSGMENVTLIGSVEVESLIDQCGEAAKKEESV